LAKIIFVTGCFDLVFLNTQHLALFELFYRRKTLRFLDFIKDALNKKRLITNSYKNYKNGIDDASNL